MIITIDGPAGTGKSTVAKRVAERLAMAYFDTGALYRSVALFALHCKIDPSDEVAIEKMLKSFSFEIHMENGHKSYYVGGKNVTEDIRSPKVNAIVSVIAALSSVRRTLLKVQHAFGKKEGGVFEGRDLGSVVFPEAEVKIFLDARPEVRAQRRRDEMIGREPELAEKMDLKQMQAELLKRDQIDSSRELAPLKCPDNACRIDTSDLTIDQVVDTIVELVKKHG